MSEGVVRSLGSKRFLDWSAMGAHGAARGILICWDKRTLEVLEMEVGQFSISCRGIWDDPWCLRGDFNVTLSQWERSNQGRLTSAMRRNNQFWARLDRFLVTQNWLDHFSGVVQSRLPRPTSDHFPILLKGGVGGGRASFRLATKLKVMKEKIKGWNRDVFRRLEVNKISALQQVEFWDRVESERSLSEGETELKKEAKETFKKWVLLEETHWRQLSRELWLKEEDKNTGFFHRMANAHRRNNSLDRIKINRVWLAEEHEGLHLQHLNLNEAEALELPFIEEEIHFALVEMNGDKAPSPDGFIVAFCQFCWDFVKEEIVDLFKEFFDKKSFARVSILPSWLKKVLGKVVSVDQNVFVRGRQILDASLIANEVIDFWHKRKEKGLICKLDIKKAYDSINWNFLMKSTGVPAGYFSNSRGLRQGDPLSPYLFVWFSRERGMEMNVSHLLFVDDTIIFCEARKEHLTSLSWILAWFKATSSLRINLAKSELIPIGEVEDIEEMAVELGCRVGSLPTVYLGLPLGATTRPHLCGMGWKKE
ncbi:hypothetical protein CK203_002122 [Vitis vinifera]|uniref:Reverse transcriptase domain-containing protein n=1 Tax=Vitis vinifera TaxID=29760 RepID=A0A438KKA4_VITVI|nr:hypothetical protein CK203_002122 [Vitis vinifera]